MRIFLTGGAGFIGFHAARALLARGHEIVAIDNLNPYYSPALKEARLAQLTESRSFEFLRGDIADSGTLEAAAQGASFDVILHLAAQAGVRHALTDPESYTRSNLVGHANVLEFARAQKTPTHLVYASSSSVYGNDTQAPFSETARADKPVSYYGATKRAGELLSHSYAELFGLKQTGLRFFTVYGPWGRPDMAYWTFTDSILADRPIPVFGHGKLRRDFTYIDDIVSAVVRIVETPFAGSAGAPHRIFNLGNNHPQTVLDLIHAIEDKTNHKAKIEETDGPPGDVNETYADISRAGAAFGFKPTVTLTDGIGHFVDWFRTYRR
jgi:UDP-glucuronate 4-epimerase